MSALITLAQAKAHLRLPPDADPADTDLQLKLDAAEAIILDYLKNQAPDPSPIIQAAILLQVAELSRFRGDDDQGPPTTDGYLSPVITNLLRRLREPTLA